MFSSNEMFLPLLLIMIVAPIGAIDLIYYHVVKFKLYSRPDSYVETIVHLIRGVLFSVGAFILLNYKPQGMWYWVTGLFFVLDFINSIADVSIEERSRKTLGGIPTPEYIIHTVGSTFAGAITMAYFILGWEFRLLPTGLTSLPPDSFHSLFLVNGYGLVAGGLALTIFEGFLLFKACTLQRKLA